VRAVIDTNVFVSALINRKGAPAKIRNRWSNSQFLLVTSIAIEVEYTYVLLQSQVPRGEVKELLADVRARALMVPIHGTLQVCSDPDDDVFLETAIAGKAEFLVTKNLKHYPRKSYQGVRIVKVSKFLHELEKIKP